MPAAVVDERVLGLSPKESPSPRACTHDQCRNDLRLPDQGPSSSPGNAVVRIDRRSPIRSRHLLHRVVSCDRSGSTACIASTADGVHRVEAHLRRVRSRACEASTAPCDDRSTAGTQHDGDRSEDERNTDGTLRGQLCRERVQLPRSLVHSANAPTLVCTWKFGEGPVPTRTYTAANSYAVTLTARDECGLTDTTQPTMTIATPVANVAPTAVLDAPSSTLLLSFSRRSAAVTRTSATREPGCQISVTVVRRALPPHPREPCRLPDLHREPDRPRRMGSSNDDHQHGHGVQPVTPSGLAPNIAPTGALRFASNASADATLVNVDLVLRNPVAPASDHMTSVA